MKRTTVMMDELTYEQLQVIARRKRTQSSKLIREAVTRYVVEENQASTSPLEPLIGMFDGPATDLGARTKEIFAEVMDKKFPPRAHDDPDR